MNDLWKDRLSQINNLEDRRLLKDVLTGVFEQIESYSNAQLESLERRVFQELKDQESLYDIHCSMVKFCDYDPIDEFQYPINPEDVKEDSVDVKAIVEEIRSGGRPVLGKFYLDMDYLQLEEVKRGLSKRRFQARLTANEKEYPIEVSIRPYLGYRKEVERLYHIFLLNDIPWRSVLHPYLYKFMEIRLESGLGSEKIESLQEIAMDLEELEPYRQVGNIPLWNVRQMACDHVSFPVAAVNRVHYEYDIALEQMGDDHGYLVDARPEDVHSIHREAGSFRILSPKEGIASWSILQVVSPEGFAFDRSRVVSNGRMELFTDRFARMENRVIRSTAEIARLTNTYLAAKELALEQVTICEAGSKEGETYDLNPFIKDQIRTKEHKQVMQLSFRRVDVASLAQENLQLTSVKGTRNLIADHLVRDYVSFLVSEVQSRFPEFRCVGELL